MYRKLFATLIIILFLVSKIECQRPFYIIGHMANSIPKIKEHLEKGANALESDISFLPNGSIEAVYHQSPCTCLENCLIRAKFSEFLNNLHEISNSQSESIYQKQLTLYFMDLKLWTVRTLDGKIQAGVELADAVIDHLWKLNGSNTRFLKVLLYISSTNNIQTISGFRKRFHERNYTAFLNYVEYDGGQENSPEEIQTAFKSLNINSHIWQGYGTINCSNVPFPDNKLRNLLKIRDSPNGYIDKVYHWTADNRDRIIKSLQLDVDGIITNTPKLVNSIIKERFISNFKIASVADNPFIKYVPSET